MRARTNHDRAVCSLRRSHALLRRSLALIARLQLLLQLFHQHVHQVFLDNLEPASRSRASREFLSCEAFTHSPKMVKEMDVIEFLFLMVKVWGLR